MEKLIKGTGKYNAVVARLQNCTATISQVQQYFQLTPEVLTELKNIAARAVLADFYKNTTPSRPYKTNTYRAAGL